MSIASILLIKSISYIFIIAMHEKMILFRILPAMHTLLHSARTTFCLSKETKQFQRVEQFELYYSVPAYIQDPIS